MYLIRSRPNGTAEVLLGHKKTGLGSGKLVGLGGKLEPGESPAAAAAREAYEEARVAVATRDLQPVGRIDYYFPAKPTLNQRSHVFLCTRWNGEPEESSEIAPAWHMVSAIPFDRMWDDAQHWLPKALAGEIVNEAFTFAEDLETVVSGG